MALQNISPINDQLADTIVRSSEPWIETSPGMAWTKAVSYTHLTLPTNREV